MKTCGGLKERNTRWALQEAVWLAYASIPQMRRDKIADPGGLQQSPHFDLERGPLTYLQILPTVVYQAEGSLWDLHFKPPRNALHPGLRLC